MGPRASDVDGLDHGIQCEANNLLIYAALYPRRKGTTTLDPDKPDRIAMHADERRSVGVVALIAMIRMFGLFALLPVLSLYARDLQDATPFLIGLAVGAYGLTQAAFQIPLGALSDRVGRLPVIVTGLAIFAAGSVVAALSDSIHGVIAGRFLQGAGAISATLTALITDATRPEVRTRSMAVFGVGIGASFMIAFAAGPLIAAKFGVLALFWVAAGMAVIAALLLRLLPDIPQPKRRESWSLVPAFRADLLRIDFYVFLLHAIMTATFVALPLLLYDRLDIPLTSHWEMYIGSLVVSLGIAVPMIMKDNHQGRGYLIGLAVSFILMAQLGLTFFAFSAVPVFAALVIYFAGFNFLEAGLPARLSMLAEEKVRGASLGVFSSAQFLGAFVGGLIGGRFLGQGRPTDVFFVCALLAGIWLALQGFGRLRK
jgi:MFS family permease